MELEQDDSLPAAALPVLLAADARLVATVADERQALALQVPAWALAQAQPGELEWRHVQASEPVADDWAVGYSAEGCLDGHCREPVAAEPRRERELPGR